ncbi:MAG: preprotein translocase subunit YajC [Campylobacter sp.]|uniref:preprotein translocase subunit YajC n=1 Tax=Campylobacter sp. TaxID=205 RepID=UPI002A899036|nr:preprotein translocase subunit YajC [Campylobacter sp.]MCI7549431.1 preprotein translocase subunit YajC [Campylobacter sp.]MDY4451228.1 preprotein translocase subunit YajC [Campylobacter sp.]
MQGDLLSSLLPFAFLILIFWFLVIRPQQMQAKKHKEMLNALTKGDKIITNGGLVAEVVNAEGDFIKVKLNDDVIVRLDRAFVAKKYEDIVAEVKK